jgi:hypothetical protein
MSKRSKRRGKGCSDTDDEDGETSLWSCAKSGDLAGVKAALRQGVDIDAQNKAGHTAAHSAASGNHLHVLKMLRDRGASFEIVDGTGRTCASEAAKYGSIGALKYFHDTLGLDLSRVKRGDGKTPEVRSYLEKVGRHSSNKRNNSSKMKPTDDNDAKNSAKIWYRDDPRNKKGQFQRKLGFSGAEKKRQLQEKRARKRAKEKAAATEAEFKRDQVYQEIHSNTNHTSALLRDHTNPGNSFMEGGEAVNIHARPGSAATAPIQASHLNSTEEWNAHHRRLSSAHLVKETAESVGQRKQQGHRRLVDKTSHMPTSATNTTSSANGRNPWWQGWVAQHLPHPVRPRWHRGMGKGTSCKYGSSK